MIKQQMTVIGIPLVIQLTLGTFFTLADLGKVLKMQCALSQGSVIPLMKKFLSLKRYIKWIENIKIQSKKKIPVDKEKMMDAVKIAFRNVFGLSLLCDPIIMKITQLR